jgi:hypothetical protein
MPQSPTPPLPPSTLPSPSRVTYPHPSPLLALSPVLLTVYFPRPTTGEGGGSPLLSPRSLEGVHADFGYGLSVNRKRPVGTNRCFTTYRYCGILAE